MTTLLPDNFTGGGEVSGFLFEKLAQTDTAYLFKVTDDRHVHFEVFKRRSSPVCIDFANKIFSEVDFKETYPKSNSFGVWAWTMRDEILAKEKLESL